MKSFGRISGFYCSNIKKPCKHSFAGLFKFNIKSLLFNQRQLINQVFGTCVFINDKQHISDINIDGSILGSFKPD